MPFPFGKSQKNPADIVRSLKENVAHIEKLDAGDSKKIEKVSLFVYNVEDVIYFKHKPSHQLFFNNEGCRRGVQKSGLAEGGP